MHRQKISSPWDQASVRTSLQITNIIVMTGGIDLTQGNAQIPAGLVNFYLVYSWVTNAKQNLIGLARIHNVSKILRCALLPRKRKCISIHAHTHLPWIVTWGKDIAKVPNKGPRPCYNIK